MRAGELARALPPVTAGQPLESALTLLVQHDRAGLPVLSTDHRQVVGWLTHHDVLTAYTTRLRADAAQALAEPGQTSPPAGDLADYRIVDLELGGRQRLVGLAVGEIAWPAGSRLLAIRRDDDLIPVTGRVHLLQNDRLTVLVPADHADTLGDTLSAASPT
jgi:CIC family chloride channel protein